jgi:CheY-like chemotaxis protein/HPt (histidine-containing phosphotransfer) domain-containing protein
MFLKTVPQQIGKLRFALERNDAGNLAKIAHGFKLTCSNMGAQTLADYARSLEEIGAQGHTKGANELLAAIESDLPSVIAPLLNDFATSPIANLINSEAGLASIRILLISNAPDFQLVISEALRAPAFWVDKAASGAQALEQIKHQLPDIVLLDAVTESLDGVQICRLLKTNPALADTPIVILTEAGDAAAIKNAFAAGAADFIVKPIDYPVFIHRLYFMLRASRNTAILRKSLLQLTAMAATSQMARLGYWIWHTKVSTLNSKVNI